MLPGDSTINISTNLEQDTRVRLLKLCIIDSSSSNCLSGYQGRSRKLGKRGGVGWEEVGWGELNPHLWKEEKHWKTSIEKDLFFFCVDDMVYFSPVRFGV